MILIFTKKTLKLASILTLFFFLSQDFNTYASPAGFSAPPAASAALAASFQIPKDLGTVEEIFSGRQDKHIVFIQDAHYSLEAQLAITKLIGRFVRDHGVRTVFEEGYEGPVPTDRLFGRVRDKQARQKISRFLLDHLRIGAAEYAHINREKDFRLIGADDVRYHLEGIAHYKEAKSFERSTREDIAALRAGFLELARSHFPKEFFGWWKTREKFKKGQIDFIAYQRRTVALFPPQALASYPHTQEFFAKLAAADPSAGNIRASELVAEAGRMEKDLADRSLKTGTARALYRYLTGLELIEKLNSLSLTPEDYETLRRVLPALRTRPAARFIARHTGRTVVLSRFWEAAVLEALGFYDSVERRDRAARPYFEKFIRDPRESVIVVVYGGFHRPNLTRFLKKKNVSYSVVMPRITQADPRSESNYIRLMSGGAYPFEKSTSRPENIFEMDPLRAQTVLLRLEAQMTGRRGLESAVRTAGVRSETRARAGALSMALLDGRKKAGSPVAETFARIGRWWGGLFPEPVSSDAVFKAISETGSVPLNMIRDRRVRAFLEFLARNGLADDIVVLGGAAKNILFAENSRDIDVSVKLTLTDEEIAMMRTEPLVAGERIIRESAQKLARLAKALGTTPERLLNPEPGKEFRFRGLAVEFLGPAVLRKADGTEIPHRRLFADQKTGEVFTSNVSPNLFRMAAGADGRFYGAGTGLEDYSRREINFSGPSKGAVIFRDVLRGFRLKHATGFRFSEAADRLLRLTLDRFRRGSMTADLDIVRTEMERIMDVALKPEAVRPDLEAYGIPAILAALKAPASAPQKNRFVVRSEARQRQTIEDGKWKMEKTRVAVPLSTFHLPSSQVSASFRSEMRGGVRDYAAALHDLENRILRERKFGLTERNELFEQFVREMMAQAFSGSRKATAQKIGLMTSSLWRILDSGEAPRDWAMRFLESEFFGKRNFDFEQEIIVAGLGKVARGNARVKEFLRKVSAGQSPVSRNSNAREAAQDGLQDLAVIERLAQVPVPPSQAEDLKNLQSGPEAVSRRRTRSEARRGMEQGYTRRGFIFTAAGLAGLAGAWGVGKWIRTVNEEIPYESASASIQEARRILFERINLYVRLSKKEWNTFKEMTFILPSPDAAVRSRAREILKRYGPEKITDYTFAGGAVYNNLRPMDHILRQPSEPGSRYDPVEWQREKENVDAVWAGRVLIELDSPADAGKTKAALDRILSALPADSRLAVQTDGSMEIYGTSIYQVDLIVPDTAEEAARKVDFFFDTDGEVSIENLRARRVNAQPWTTMKEGANGAGGRAYVDFSAPGLKQRYKIYAGTPGVFPQDLPQTKDQVRQTLRDVFRRFPGGKYYLAFLKESPSSLDYTRPDVGVFFVPPDKVLALTITNPESGVSRSEARNADQVIEAAVRFVTESPWVSHLPVNPWIAAGTAAAVAVAAGFYIYQRYFQYPSFLHRWEEDKYGRVDAAKRSIQFIWSPIWIPLFLAFFFCAMTVFIPLIIAVGVLWEMIHEDPAAALALGNSTLNLLINFATITAPVIAAIYAHYFLKAARGYKPEPVRVWSPAELRGLEPARLVEMAKGLDKFEAGQAEGAQALEELVRRKAAGPILSVRGALQNTESRIKAGQALGLLSLPVPPVEHARGEAALGAFLERYPELATAQNLEKHFYPFIQRFSYSEKALGQAFDLMRQHLDNGTLRKDDIFPLMDHLGGSIGYVAGNQTEEFVAGFFRLAAKAAGRIDTEHTALLQKIFSIPAESYGKDPYVMAMMKEMEKMAPEFYAGHLAGLVPVAETGKRFAPGAVALSVELLAAGAIREAGFDRADLLIAAAMSRFRIFSFEGTAGAEFAEGLKSRRVAVEELEAVNAKLALPETLAIFLKMRKANARSARASELEGLERAYTDVSQKTASEPAINALQAYVRSGPRTVPELEAFSSELTGVMGRLAGTINVTVDVPDIGPYGEDNGSHPENNPEYLAALEREASELLAARGVNRSEMRQAVEAVSWTTELAIRKWVIGTLPYAAYAAAAIAGAAVVVLLIRSKLNERQRQFGDVPSFRHLWTKYQEPGPLSWKQGQEIGFYVAWILLTLAIFFFPLLAIFGPAILQAYASGGMIYWGLFLLSGFGAGFGYFIWGVAAFVFLTEKFPLIWKILFYKPEIVRMIPAGELDRMPLADLEKKAEGLNRFEAGIAEGTQAVETLARRRQIGALVRVMAVLRREAAWAPVTAAFERFGIRNVTAERAAGTANNPPNYRGIGNFLEANPGFATQEYFDQVYLPMGKMGALPAEEILNKVKEFRPYGMSGPADWSILVTAASQSVSGAQPFLDFLLEALKKRSLRPDLIRSHGREFATSVENSALEAALDLARGEQGAAEAARLETVLKIAKKWHTTGWRAEQDARQKGVLDVFKMGLENGKWNFPEIAAINEHLRSPEYLSVAAGMTRAALMAEGGFPAALNRIGQMLERNYGSQRQNLARFAQAGSRSFEDFDRFLKSLELLKTKLAEVIKPGEDVPDTGPYGEDWTRFVDNPEYVAFVAAAVEILVTVNSPFPDTPEGPVIRALEMMREKQSFQNPAAQLLEKFGNSRSEMRQGQPPEVNQAVEKWFSEFPQRASDWTHSALPYIAAGIAAAAAGVVYARARVKAQYDKYHDVPSFRALWKEYEEKRSSAFFELKFAGWMIVPALVLLGLANYFYPALIGLSCGKYVYNGVWIVAGSSIALAMFLGFMNVFLDGTSEVFPFMSLVRKIILYRPEAIQPSRSVSELAGMKIPELEETAGGLNLFEAGIAAGKQAVGELERRRALGALVRVLGKIGPEKETRPVVGALHNLGIEISSELAHTQALGGIGNFVEKNPGRSGNEHFQQLYIPLARYWPFISPETADQLFAGLFKFERLGFSRISELGWLLGIAFKSSGAVEFLGSLARGLEAGSLTPGLVRAKGEEMAKILREKRSFELAVEMAKGPGGVVESERLATVLKIAGKAEGLRSSAPSGTTISNQERVLESVRTGLDRGLWRLEELGGIEKNIETLESLPVALGMTRGSLLAAGSFPAAFARIEKILNDNGWDMRPLVVRFAETGGRSWNDFEVFLKGRVLLHARLAEIEPPEIVGVPTTDSYGIEWPNNSPNPEFTGFMDTAVNLMAKERSPLSEEASVLALKALKEISRGGTERQKALALKLIPQFEVQRSEIRDYAGTGVREWPAAVSSRQKTAAPVLTTRARKAMEVRNAFGRWNERAWVFIDFADFAGFSPGQREEIEKIAILYHQKINIVFYGAPRVNRDAFFERWESLKGEAKNVYLGPESLSGVLERFYRADKRMIHLSSSGVRDLNGLLQTASDYKKLRLFQYSSEDETGLAVLALLYPDLDRIFQQARVATLSMIDSLFASKVRDYLNTLVLAKSA